MIGSFILHKSFDEYSLKEDSKLFFGHDVIAIITAQKIHILMSYITNQTLKVNDRVGLDK